MANCLFEAVYAGNLDAVERLISADMSDANTNVLKKDELGLTALHYASREGHFEIVKFLIESGSNISERSHFGLTALHEASIIGNLEIVKLLVSVGISNGNTNILAKDYLGNTALHLAVHQGHFDIVKCLITTCIDIGIDIDIKDCIGRTPIHVTRNKEIREFLMEQLEIQQNSYVLK